MLLYRYACTLCSSQHLCHCSCFVASAKPSTYFGSRELKIAGNASIVEHFNFLRIVTSASLDFQLLETGEWPTAAMSKRISGIGVSAVLDTPVGTPDPSRVGTPNHSEYSCAMDNEDEVRKLSS